MKFYRSLPEIKAMTFDLDDTIYDNRPIIVRVEAQMRQWLTTEHPISASQPISWWAKVKRQVASDNPEFKHDVTKWRYAQIETGLRRLGYSDSQAKQAAERAISKVLELRSDFTVPQTALDTMQALSKRYPLVAITNGNVDPSRIGLVPYFQLVLKAGPDGRAKPYPDMFEKALVHFAELGIEAKHILHVGDHLKTDVHGAKLSGLQACWFNDQGAALTTHKHARVLPDVEIQQLGDLLKL